MKNIRDTISYNIRLYIMIKIVHIIKDNISDKVSYPVEINTLGVLNPVLRNIHNLNHETN